MDKKIGTCKDCRWLMEMVKPGIGWCFALPLAYKKQVNMFCSLFTSKHKDPPIAKTKASKSALSIEIKTPIERKPVVQGKQKRTRSARKPRGRKG